jgi:hypothetical protein
MVAAVSETYDSHAQAALSLYHSGVARRCISLPDEVLLVSNTLSLVQDSWKNPQHTAGKPCASNQIPALTSTWERKCIKKMRIRI